MEFFYSVFKLLNSFCLLILVEITILNSIESINCLININGGNITNDSIKFFCFKNRSSFSYLIYTSLKVFECNFVIGKFIGKIRLELFKLTFGHILNCIKKLVIFSIFDIVDTFIDLSIIFIADCNIFFVFSNFISELFKLFDIHFGNSRAEFIKLFTTKFIFTFGYLFEINCCDRFIVSTAEKNIFEFIQSVLIHREDILAAFSKLRVLEFSLTAVNSVKAFILEFAVVILIGRIDL